MLESLRERLVTVAPAVGSTILILIVGFTLAVIGKRVVRAAVKRSGLEAVAEGAGIAPLLYFVGAREGLAAFLGSCTMWAGILGTVAVVSERLGLSLVGTLTAALLAYAPRLLAALAIALGSLLFSSFVHRAVERVAMTRGDVRAPGAIASLARVIVIVMGLTLAAEQAGLEVRFLTTIFELVVGVVFIAVGLAFALGFQGIVRGMAARHYYQPLVRPGDHVAIGEDRGTVVKFGATAVVLRDENKERIVPCDRMLSTTVIVDRSGESR